MYKENPPVVHKDNIYVLVYTFLEKALHYVYTAACMHTCNFPQSSYIIKLYI